MKWTTKNLPQRTNRFLRRKIWGLLRRLHPNLVMTFTVDPEHRLKIRYPLNTSVGCGLFQRCYEAAELNFLRRSLRPGNVVFDVGANAGIFTVIAARRVGAAGMVHAFEPGEAEQALLAENIALNQLSNVKVFAGAVSNQTGSARLAVSRDGALNSLAHTEHPLQQIVEWRTVPTITLDAYAEQERASRVDFLKVDVEGAEKMVFEGATELLKRNPGMVILFEAVELNSKSFGYRARDLFDWLRQQGMTLSYLDETGAPIAFTAHDVRFGDQIYNFVARKSA